MRNFMVSIETPNGDVSDIGTYANAYAAAFAFAKPIVQDFVFAGKSHPFTVSAPILDRIAKDLSASGYADYKLSDGSIVFCNVEW